MAEEELLEESEDEQIAKDDMASPLRVRATQSMGRLDAPDYIPSMTEEELAKASKVKEQCRRLREAQIVKDLKVPLGGSDFIPNEVSVEAQARREILIRDRAKALYEAYRDKNEAFAKALKVYKASTEEERENPNPDLKIAMEILEKGDRLTRKQALKLAEKEIGIVQRVHE